MTEEKKQPLASFEMGAEGGYAPNLDEWVSNQKFIPRNLVPVIVRNFAAKVENSYLCAQSAKSVLELFPIEIVGMKSGIILDTDTGAVHNQASIPEFLYERSEIYGRAIEGFFTEWVQDVQARAYAFKSEGEEVFQAKLTSASIDIMLIEPDPTVTTVVQAWFCKNFHPRSVEGVPGRRDLQTIAEVEKVKVKFSSTIEMGRTTLAQAQDLLNGISLASANPYTRQAFVDAIADDVLKKSQD